MEREMAWSRFVDKVVIVTGAGRGIGRACALAFATEGACVALVDTDDTSLAALESQFQAQGVRTLARACDVSRPQDVQGVVAAVVGEFGTVHILINNAGAIRTTRPLEKIPVDEWDLVMNVNLRGPYIFSREVLPIMRRQMYGRIVNISSSAGRSTSELGGAHYTASKAGLLGLTRHTAKEYGPYGVRVNSVCPGLIETPMVRENATDQILNYWLSQIPMNRLGGPGEIADLVLFLASEQASYITGATVDINGGSLLL